MVDCITYTPENLENLEFKYFEILSQLERKVADGLNGFL